MVLKNLITNFNISFVLLLFILIHIINLFLIETSIRNKFFLFLILFFFFFCLGLYYSLDGIVFLFVISELSVLLIFITMFSQLYSYSNKSIKSVSNIFFIILLVFNIIYYDTKVLSYENFYSFYNIQVNDFYYFYNYFFEKQILVTILIIFIITFYSIFFIILYFNLKKRQNTEQTKFKQLNILRKQNILHQSNYTTKTRIFKKINVSKKFILYPEWFQWYIISQSYTD